MCADNERPTKVTEMTGADDEADVFDDEASQVSGSDDEGSVSGLLTAEQGDFTFGKFELSHYEVEDVIEEVLDDVLDGSMDAQSLEQKLTERLELANSKQLDVDLIASYAKAFGRIRSVAMDVEDSEISPECGAALAQVGERLAFLCDKFAWKDGSLVLPALSIGDIFVELGRSFSILNKLHQAQRFLERAIAALEMCVDKENLRDLAKARRGVACLSLARVMRRLQHPDSALDFYLKALNEMAAEAEPEESVSEVLTEYVACIGEIPAGSHDAKTILETALQMAEHVDQGPVPVQLLDEVGQTYMKHGLFEEALLSFEKAGERYDCALMFDQSREARLDIAKNDERKVQVYLALGQIELAAECWEEATRIHELCFGAEDPTVVTMAQTLKMLKTAAAGRPVVEDHRDKAHLAQQADGWD